MRLERQRRAAPRGSVEGRRGWRTGRLALLYGTLNCPFFPARTCFPAVYKLITFTTTFTGVFIHEDSGVELEVN